MKVVIVYESLWGNTQAIADEVAAGFLEADTEVIVAVRGVASAEIDEVADADLLVVGAPTHMRGLSSARSRHMGLATEAKKSEPVAAVPGAEGPGVRDWLRGLPKGSGRAAAAFDTRIEHRLAGGAARRIARRLRRRGYVLRADPIGFYVTDSPGPLRPEERDRARQWAAQLLASLNRPAVH